ncbi:sensor histidine kinase [Flavobacterium sp. GT3R68]|uniref:sensor histidine kinase n=1 Tax=Flavobacterium sp. GT3R68 TaxID=2594437 RepID=UPI000F8895E3|nr:sensor histidine kinase [Flavobacterium sp. GT3R68]RTY96037.1 sensor histidine kinase [Flavobacterium sp. GSN2]TRW93810.1 sensor histidine kinase [Flavobacterium sp. GT3R68]
MGKNFSIDARLILQLGRDSIKNHTTALTELVKNAYDADATKVDVEIRADYIRVADNGFGMTEDEINKNWLVIGYSEKRHSKESEKGRRKTGEKGIGRIATDRLGKIVEIKTKSALEVGQGLRIDWEQFDVDKKSLDSIDIEEIENPTLTIPKRDDGKISGTEIIITSLREQWTSQNIQDLYDELSYFISPAGADDKKFEINFANDFDGAYSKKVKSAIDKLSEIDLTAIYDGGDEIIYTLTNKYNSVITTKIMKITELYQTLSIEDLDNKTELNSGPFNLDLSLFIQKTSLLSGTNFKLGDLRDFLNNNSGVKFFRDNIVVKPYGFAKSVLGYDWLNLAERKARDPAGVGRDTYKISPNQLVGSVFITRDLNHNLKDSAAREGLVENDSFFDVKNVVSGAVFLMESYRVKLLKEIEKKPEKKPKTSYDSIKLITTELDDVKKELEKIQAHVGTLDDFKGRPLSMTINKISHAIEQTEYTFENLLDEKRVLNALATLGISSAVFGHETEDAISNLKISSKNARDYLTVDIDIAQSELNKAYEQAKLVSGWGAFALARVEREKRSKRKRMISKVVVDTIEQIKPALESKSIELIEEYDDFYATSYSMDIESIVMNLITNAFTFCVNENKVRKIKIVVSKNIIETKIGYNIIVSDTGNGVPDEYIDRIFSPLFSTKITGERKHNGTGLGLTIVKSIVDEMNGFIVVSKDKELKGAKFDIWLPTEIN